MVSACVDLEENIIGGNGIVVEMDESKFGKRKHNRGHPVEGVWVGGVERTPERKVFITAVKDRTSETLLDIIHKHVNPGSIIYTDVEIIHLNILLSTIQRFSKIPFLVFIQTQ
jgi:hypothetical protein